jgi:CO/xanthine dehydrogenase FAD-binding subunit
MRSESVPWEKNMLETVVTPQSLADLRKVLKQTPKAKVMAGGTLVMPVINQGAHGITTLISLNRLGTNKISVKKGVALIGAGVSIAELGQKSELKFLLPMIDSIGSPTLRNMATVGGNLFAEQPYGDLAVCLIALGAKASVVGPPTKRNATVEEIISKGVKPGEVVAEVSFVIPKPGTFKYVKAARRALNSASIVTVAAVVTISKGTIAECRVALGGVAPKPLRAKSVEKLLVGHPCDETHVKRAAAAASKDISPFSDAYASAWYRHRVAPVHISRAILGLS